MEHSKDKLRELIKSITQVLGIGIGFVILFVVSIVIFFTWTIKSCNADIENRSKTGLTPTEITKIQRIGQWEFLSISDEELIDTIRHGFFGDDELARIYYGTLRLGIDLNDAADDWIKMDKDTIVLTLPPIKLLDNHFLDEAKTKAFYETGNWTEADKAKLSNKAAQTMKKRCMTPENIRSAEQNAITQFSNMMRSMGHGNTRIIFSQPNKK